MMRVSIVSSSAVVPLAPASGGVAVDGTATVFTTALGVVNGLLIAVSASSVEELRCTSTQRLSGHASATW